MIYIQLNNTVTFYDAPETIERAIHNLLMCRDDTDVGMGYDGALTQPAYEQGLNDAWECARKLILDDGLTGPDIHNIFGDSNEHHVLRTVSAPEAIAKIKEYEEKKAREEAELKVGDEIEVRSESSIPKMVVTQIDNQYVSTVDADGETRCIDKNTNRLVKTGRHFGQIEEVMWQMKGE